MSTARMAYAAPAPVGRDRTRSERVIARQSERRTARAAKRTPAPLNLYTLAAEIGATVGTVAR